jgi:hypothetical protein
MSFNLLELVNRIETKKKTEFIIWMQNFHKE